MKTKPIEEIRKACIEANPEIMELKFGCEVKHLVGDELLGTVVGTEDTKQILYITYALHYPNKTSVLHWHTENCKILGRAIRLTDVLLAIPKHGLELNSSANFLYCEYVDGKNEEVHFDWNFQKDRLEDQSEETLSFIANLLK